jgi:hypothetical protein
MHSHASRTCRHGQPSYGATFAFGAGRQITRRAGYHTGFAPERQGLIGASCHGEVICLGVDALDEQLRQATCAHGGKQLVNEPSCATLVLLLGDQTQR